jgi:Uma2 family endonuclease
MNRLIDTDAALPGTRVDPRYPDSDGRYMGDSGFHSKAMAAILDVLVQRYKHDPTVYVVNNIVWYYEDGNRDAHRDPDILVARGVRGNHIRCSFRAWEEKVTPCVLFEIASKRTWRKDVGLKRELYASLGVKEYFVFDPEGCFLKPVLQGFKSVKGESVPLKADSDGGLVSKQLGVRLVPEGVYLSFIDLQTGQRLLTGSERADALAAELEKLRGHLGQSP